MTDQEVASLILRRRRQLLVHSIIYYRMAESLVSDHQWAGWALELEQLQRDHPAIAATVDLADAFKDFDHSTGYNLPLTDPKWVGKARWLVEERQRRNG